jgi:hypothetical protein
VGGWLTGTGMKRASTAAIGALALLAAAGCSSGSGSNAAPPQAETPARAVQLAASVAGQVNSFTATLDLNLTLTTGTSGAESVAGAGTVSEVVHPLLGEFTFSTLKAAGISLPGGMSEIITPNEIYIKLAELTSLLHTDKQWLGLPVSSASSAAGLNLGSLFSQSDTSNPLTITQLLAAATDVKMVGTGTMDGVPVTEYTGTYTLATALDKLPASVRSATSAAFKQSGLGAAKARFTVWIDAQHIVRKEITVLASSTFSESITITVTSVNQPVTITPPSAGQVYTITSADLDSGGI